MTTITVPRHIELAIKCLEEDPVQANAINNALAWLRAALAQQAEEPMFWVRFRSDGGYEGPIHNDALERVRKESGAWVPLYPHPAPTPPEQEADKRDAARWRWWRRHYGTNMVVNLFGNGCVNKTIKMVEEYIDAAMKEQP